MYSRLKFCEVCEEVEAKAKYAEEAKDNNDQVECSIHDLIV